MTSRMSSGSSRADNAVEPTRSQNITVSWRRSAASVDEGVGDGPLGSATICAGPKLAIALRSRLRSPKGTPSFSMSLSVRSGRTSGPIFASRNACSYSLSPRPRSQSPTSIVASQTPCDDNHPMRTWCPDDCYPDRGKFGRRGFDCCRQGAGEQVAVLWLRRPDRAICRHAERRHRRSGKGCAGPAMPGGGMGGIDY